MSSWPENVIALPTAEDDRPKIATGEYTAVYVRHEVSFAFARKKLRIDFRLVEHLGIVLSRWYHLAPHKNRLQCARHGALVRELTDVLGRRVRHDRLPITDLRDLLLRVRVKDVIKDSGSEQLSELNRYSVVEKILGRVE